MKALFYSVIAIFLTIDLNAQVTYSSDIAEIIYSKCSVCHRSGEIGPMTLTNYDEVKSWGATIQYVTESKYMPPWKPDHTYSRFLEENFLTDEEINKIKGWVESGMPRGNAAEEPSFPDFPDGSVLGEPDLVLEMSSEWLHKGNNKDDYRYFVLPTNLTEDKVVKAIEFRPGNTKIVHHALIFEDTSGQAAQNDAATPEYGFNGFGSFLGDDQEEILNQKQYPGYVPGQKPILYPDGIGQVLHAGSDIVVQLHYAPWPIDEYDQSKINIFFADDQEQIEREVEAHIMVPFPEVIGELFVIPASTIRTFHGKWTVPKDISLVSITPHMHLLGESWEVWMEKPNGERVNLIKINDWDFNWQGAFNFERYLVAPKGTVVHAVATYNNTTSNPNNPSNPPQFVSWGEGTEDEMYYLPINYVDYQDGDEDVIFNENPLGIEDQTLDISTIYPISPNPVLDFTVVGFNLKRGMALNIDLYDIQGNNIRRLRQSEFYNIGEHHINFSSKQLNPGTYFVKITGNDFILTQKFIKQ